MATVFCLVGYYDQIIPRSLQLSFLVNSEHKADFEIYYDIGRGLTEKDHQTQEIDEVNSEMSLHFCLPIFSRLKLLRFDPAKGYTSMVIKEIQYGYDGQPKNVIPLNSIEPINQIKSYSILDDGLHLESIPGGEDPGFVIRYDFDPLRMSLGEKIFYYFKYAIGGIVTAFVLRSLYIFFILRA